MKPSEIVADLPLGPGDRHENRLLFRILMRYLADHVHLAQLESGMPLQDATDFRMWLDQLTAAIPPRRCV